MKRVGALLLAMGILSGSLPDGAAAQTPLPRERLGFRTGYIATLDELDAAFGDGGHLTLQFTERIYQQLYFDLRIGAMYLGDAKNTEIATELLQNSNILIPGQVATEMRLLFFSVGPQANLRLGEFWTGYAGAGVGVYSVSILFDTAIQAFDSSDQHLGMNTSAGVLWRFTDTWNLDLNFTLHHFWTSEDRGDLFYLFTDEGGSSPWVMQFATGITIDLR